MDVSHTGVAERGFDWWSDHTHDTRDGEIAAISRRQLKFIRNVTSDYSVCRTEHIYCTCYTNRPKYIYSCTLNHPVLNVIPDLSVNIYSIISRNFHSDVEYWLTLHTSKEINKSSLVKTKSVLLEIFILWHVYSKRCRNTIVEQR
jgi:hypothetical protein